MAPQTPKRLVSNALEDMSEVNLQKFCMALMEMKVDGRRVVRRNQVDGKKFWELADLMVGVFTETKVVNVAVEILRDIGCCQEAEDLAKDAASSSPSPPVPPSPISDKELFVDNYRVELIQRVSNISAILDQLLKEKVITCEAYDTIRSKPTNSEKMRAIYDTPIKSTRRAKEIFYDILKEQELFLVNDLEGN
ncbi:apoptosis-associated speck-like protein containing a CARD [Austrofundulus limnaeus]|uniref:Apoptosis-associated speck-like protein containing a CARD n=1 Tax=Austrofundulus limnaeus TaxID=52670 RepID=A0A2I4CW30_AUSLI|nr:PREDICTED: apoptosis-associated speck-like protein containing a CARD [Austrofundulus limnaeus]